MRVYVLCPSGGERSASGKMHGSLEVGGVRCVVWEIRVSETNQRAEGEHRKESNHPGRINDDPLPELH